jgi:hypothetical protein
MSKLHQEDQYGADLPVLVWEYGEYLAKLYDLSKQETVEKLWSLMQKVAATESRREGIALGTKLIKKYYYPITNYFSILRGIVSRVGSVLPDTKGFFLVMERYEALKAYAVMLVITMGSLYTEPKSYRQQIISKMKTDSTYKLVNAAIKAYLTNRFPKLIEIVNNSFTGRML